MATSALRPLVRIVLAAAALSAGCGTFGEDAGARAYVEHHLDAWRGVRADHVLQRFGAPDSERVRGDGGRVLVYRRKQPVLRVLDCEVEFQVGSTGRITEAHCSGPAQQCRMLLNPATRYAASMPAPVIAPRIGLR